MKKHVENECPLTILPCQYRHVGCDDEVSVKPTAHFITCTTGLRCMSCPTSGVESLIIEGGVDIRIFAFTNHKNNRIQKK